MSEISTFYYMYAQSPQNELHVVIIVYGHEYKHDKIEGRLNHSISLLHIHNEKTYIFIIYCACLCLL